MRAKTAENRHQIELRARFFRFMAEKKPSVPEEFSSKTKGFYRTGVSAAVRTHCHCSTSRGSVHAALAGLVDGST